MPAGSTERSETVAREVAQEIAQIIAQNISQLIAQSTAKGISQETKQEEIGMGERYRTANSDNAAIMFSNDKAAFDRHLRLITELEEDSRKALEAERSYVAELREDARRHLANVGMLAELALKGAVTSDALITKQAIAHRDIAVDSTWVPGPGEEKPEEKAK